MKESIVYSIALSLLSAAIFEFVVKPAIKNQQQGTIQ